LLIQFWSKSDTGRVPFLQQVAELQGKRKKATKCFEDKEQEISAYNQSC
jgi:hypothetical protein